MINITWDEIFEALEVIDIPENIVYGVPKGGMIAAGFLKHAERTCDPAKANVILDDLVDSGRTKELYETKYPRAVFTPLIMKESNEWITFPWERDHPCADGGDSIQENIVRMLQYIGENVTRPGLIDTPNRVVRSWEELYSGYSQKVEDVFTSFEDEEYQYGGLVYLKKIEFYSMCEHHLLPFHGEALVAYIPNGPVIGTSKMARLVDLYANRLQMQERIAEQVTAAMMTHIKPLGAACMIEARHLCIACRGVKKQHSIMGYNSLKGVFLEDSHMGIAARNELMLISR